jgi:hypothetical protein
LETLRLTEELGEAADVDVWPYFEPTDLPVPAQYVREVRAFYTPLHLVSPLPHYICCIPHNILYTPLRLVYLTTVCDLPTSAQYVHEVCAFYNPLHLVYLTMSCIPRWWCSGAHVQCTCTAYILYTRPGLRLVFWFGRRARFLARRDRGRTSRKLPHRADLFLVMTWHLKSRFS